MNFLIDIDAISYKKKKICSNLDNDIREQLFTDSSQIITLSMFEDCSVQEL